MGAWRGWEEGAGQRPAWSLPGPAEVKAACDRGQAKWSTGMSLRVQGTGWYQLILQYLKGHLGQEEGHKKMREKGRFPSFPQSATNQMNNNLCSYKTY